MMAATTRDVVPVAGTGLFRRVGLFTRLLILVAAVSLPSFAVTALLVLDLREEWRSHLGTDVLHEARLVSSAVGATTEAARQVMLSVASSRAARALDPACAGQVTLLRRALPAYAFIAVLGADLRPVCGSGPAVAPSDAVLHTARLVLGGDDFVVDRYGVGAESSEPFLGVGLPVQDLDGRVVGVVVAGLSLEEMTRALEAMLAPADRAIARARCWRGCRVATAWWGSRSGRRRASCSASNSRAWPRSRGWTASRGCWASCRRQPRATA